MSKIAKPTLFTPANDLASLASKWKLVDTLMGGTDAMRNAGQEYLKANPKEDPRKYSDRLSRATLTNKYSRTIEKGVGKAFARKMNIEVPDVMEPLVYNIDGQGTSLESFSKELLKDAINYGISYVLVDYDASEIVTLEDQRTKQVYPYFVKIDPTQVLDLRVDYIDNKLQLTYFRFYESFVDYAAGGLVGEQVEQVREFVRDGDGITFNVYRKESKTKQEVLIKSGAITVDMIPIVPIYGKKTQPFLGEPVLMELAHLNAKHWWKQSDLDWNEHYGLTPILVLKGFDAGVDPTTGQSKISEFVVGASTVVSVGETGGLDWSKADASGIKAAQDSLDRLLREMDEAGLELSTRQEGSVETATGAILDAAESNSILKGIVVDLNWQLYQAVLIAGQYMGVDATNVNISIDTQYTVTQSANTADIQLWLQMYKEKVITLEELRSELKSRKLAVSEKVDEGFDNIPQELLTVGPSLSTTVVDE